MSAETGSGARAKAGGLDTLSWSHALQPGRHGVRGQGRSPSQLPSHPEEGLQDRAQPHLHFMSLSRMGRYMHTAWYWRGLSKYVSRDKTVVQFRTGLSCFVP